MASARLWVNAGVAPVKAGAPVMFRFVGTVAVQDTALSAVPAALVENPTTVPAALMPRASLAVSPARLASGVGTAPTHWVAWRAPPATVDQPTTMPVGPTP